MERTNYIERIFLAGEKGFLPILEEALREIGEDETKLVNKYKDDLPILLACLREMISQIEEICGESGKELANDLGQMIGIVRFSVPMDK
ncbi:MAG: hypothetical protein KBS74_06745 [Clostridiales bacterium]|nr:hypothetical protein [Candidatus Cacconaster stercorequi]